MINNNNQNIGQIGENIACEYLEDNSYRILERNHKKPWGEIDIIVLSPKKTLVFVEVKTMKHYVDGLKPEDQLTRDKLEKLKRSTSLYAGNSSELIDGDQGWRLDLIAITLNKPNRGGKEFDLRHYKQIL